MPANAKRVFEGIIFDVYQWQQKLFDGSFRTFEKLKRKDVVQVIPMTKDGKIVITEQEQPGKRPFISIAGGIVDEGESPLQTAERELLEEIGYKAREIVLWIAQQPTSKIDWAVYTFVARGCQKVAQQKLEPGEKITPQEVSFEEFLKIASSERFQDKEIMLEVLRARVDPQKMDELKNHFGVK